MTRHRNWWIAGTKPIPRWVADQQDFMVFADEQGVWFQTTDIEKPQAILVSPGQEIVKTDDGVWLFDGQPIDPR